MDTIGSLELRWTKGYAGEPAVFISQDVLCFKCGNNIIFLSMDGHEAIYSAPDRGGVGCMAVHSVNGVFAYSERTTEPNVHIVQFPSLLTVSTLEDGAQLEFISLTFSSSECLASISGIPDYKLTLWRYVDGTKLVVHEMPHVTPTWLAFNPANWRQLAISTLTELNVWTIEQNNEQCYLTKRKLKMPHKPMEHKASMTPAYNSVIDSYDAVKLPASTIAGLRGSEAETFEEYRDETEKVVPTTHCWTPSGEIIVGCSGGELLKVDAELNSISVLTCHKPSEHPEPADTAEHATKKPAGHSSLKPAPPMSLSRPSSSHHRAPSPAPSLSRMSGADEHEQRESVKPVASTHHCSEVCAPVPATPGLFNHIALHKKALFAGSSSGALTQVHINGNHAMLLSSHDVGAPITSLSFNSSHHRLAIGSSKGRVYVCDPATSVDESIHLVFDINCGSFVAVRTLASGSDFCVSLRESGQLQVWQAETGKIVSSVSLEIPACTMGSSPLTNLIVVGDVTGHIYGVDVTAVEQPRVIKVERLHHEAVRHIVFTMNGLLAVTGSSDGSVFVLDGRPSKNLNVLGFVPIIGRVLGVSTYSTINEDSDTQVAVSCCMEKDTANAATKLYTFTLPHDLCTNLSSRHASPKCDLKLDVINFIGFNFPEPVFGLALTMDNTVFAISKLTKMIHKLQVPPDAAKREKSRDAFLVVLEKFEGHQLPGGSIQFSPHRKWLASGGGDGHIIVRLMTSLTHVEAASVAHSFWTGGVMDFAFSPDGQCVFSTGYDGTLNCFQWAFTPSGEDEGRLAMNAAQALTSELFKSKLNEDEALHTMPTWVDYNDTSGTEVSVEEQREETERQIETAIANDAIFMPAVPAPPKSATWLDFKAYEAMTDEDKTYANIKLELREDIRQMRRKLQKMMEANEGMQQIEKLPRHEFDLDVEEQRQLSMQCEIEVQKLREEKEFDNLAKMYLTDVIRKECWDEMLIKGRGLVAFNSALEVYNFPLKERTAAELEQLAIVKVRRKIEMAELAARKEIVDSVLVNRQRALLSDDENAEADAVSDDASSTTQSTLMGSFADVVGGAAELYYSQFELCSREQKMNQICLLQETIYRIKVQYNKEFDEVFVKKEQEIAKIKERNRRIGKILQDLNINDPLYHPEMGPIEKPEMLLVTKDDEVKVEKFLTPEQWKKMEEDRKNEEERRMREKGDNWRERGLDLMMGGVLEIKKEDELKKDIPIPQFMQEKREEEFTDEEKKSVAEYQRKVKELEEEREKFRKQLELELRKLQAMVQEGTLAFDETLNQLFMKKVKSELAIYQEELKMLRLRYSILQEEEMSHRERELIELIEAKKRDSQAMSAEVVAAKKQMDEFRTEYEILVADDKLLDKGFRREFADLSNMMADQLYKYYRKRPRGQKAKMLDAAYDSNSLNPFAERPSTARRNEEAQRALDAAVQELDRTVPDNMTVDPVIWERLCHYRREKIECEAHVKQKALILADMQAFVQHRHEADERLKNEIEELGESLNRLRADRQMFFTDVEIQLLLKQGQVEVDPGKFIPDFRSCLLVHRSVVEDLNKQVKLLSDSKIASMVESKDFRKGIVQLEWEHKKMTMEMEDLQNRMRDITSMKVTREIQLYLSDPDYDNRKTQEISGLEQTIQAQKQQHERTMKDKKRTIKQIKHSIEEMMAKNDSLMRELEALNVAVNERRHIHDLCGERISETERAEHYKEIVQRRRLVDLAKAQSQEVAVLRAEVERLRMRTFAALVQVEH